MARYSCMLVYVLCITLMLVTAAPRPQSYERNHVRIHVPVIKHTKHLTRTLVKKIPVPFPVPVPVIHRSKGQHSEDTSYAWSDKGYSSNSYY